jgi:uncharacterized protein (TIGR03437 family)
MRTVSLAMGILSLVALDASAQCLMNGPSYVVIEGPYTLPTVEVGVPYSYTFKASGGSPPHTFFVYQNSRLPSGLELSVSGELTGRATTANANNTFSIITRDSTFQVVGLCDFRVAVQANRLAISPTTLPRASVGSAYSTTIQTTGGTAPYRFELVSGGYPPGLQGFANGVISGTPSSPGTYTLRMRVVDGNNNSASADLTIVVEGPSLRFETSSLAAGEVGAAYTALLRLTAGSPVATFQLLSGQLPAGLALSASGTISGTPSAVGDFNFVVRASAGTATVDAPFTIRIAASSRPLSLSDWPGASFGGGIPVSLQIPVVGGRPGFRFTLLDGVIPAGLHVSTGGLMTGTARTSGSYPQRWRVTDAAGAVAERTYQIQIAAPQTYPDAVAGQRYVERATTAGATRFALDAAGKLPLGLRLEPDGTLTGTPFAAGEYTFPLRVEFGAAAGQTLAYRLKVAAPVSELETDTVDLPAATRGRAYRQGLITVPAPTSAQLIEGTLPPGLSWNGTFIEGVPASEGYWEFLVDLRSGSRATSRRYALAVHSGALPQVDAVVSSASYHQGAVAPGEILTLFGANLDNIRAVVDGQPAPLLYATPTQSSFILPFGAGGKNSVSVVLQRNGLESFPLQVRVIAARPGVYTQSGNGLGLAAALNQDGALNTELNPAAAGSIVVLFGTGLGLVDGVVADGEAAAGAALAKVFAEGNLTVTVNGEVARTLYAGAAPGLIHGVAQVNLELPGGVSAGMAKIILTSKGRSSNEVGVWVK